MARKVLIVEDEIINAMALADMIPRWGLVVTDMVTSGEDAIRSAEREKPDVVLMDISIHGDINGLDAAREIAGRMGIPVIFMSGHDDEKTVRAAEELKPLAFLVKPLAVNRLKELLQKLDS